MAKDPTAALRRESKADRKVLSDTCGLRGAELYMRERGLFAPWNGQNVKFVPVVEGLPWNPAAKKRVVAYQVTEHVLGHWKDGQSRVRSPRGKHYVKGAWVNAHDEEIARVEVPHWDYDGTGPEAREAHERQVAHNWLDQGAKNRAYDAGKRLTWSLKDDVEAMETYEEAKHERGWPASYGELWLRPISALSDSL